MRSSSVFVLGFLQIILIAGSQSIRAQTKFWPSSGLPICTEKGWQKNPRLCSDGKEGAIIVWEDMRGGSTSDLYAQHADVRGNRLWDTAGVPVCTAANNQAIASVISDERGGAIVVWADRRGADWDIYAQRIGSGGAMLWAAEGIPVCTAAKDQTVPKCLPDNAGGVIVVWQDKRGASSDIYAQRIDGSGTPLWQKDGVAVCDEPNDQTFPEIISDDAGGCIIVWSDKRMEEDLYAQRLSSAGAPLWTPGGVVVTDEPGRQFGAKIAPHGDGGACVVWQDLRSGSTTDLYYQVLDKDGARKFQTTTEPLSKSPQAQTGLSLIPDGRKGVIAIWTDYKGAQATGDIFVGRISEKGELQWTPFSGSGLALCTAPDAQDMAVLLPDGGGGAFAVWQDKRNTFDYDLYMNRIDATGNTSFPGWSVNGSLLVAQDNNQLGPQAIPSGKGGAIIAWYDGRVQDGVADIYAQRIGFSPWLETGVASLDFGVVKVREKSSRSMILRNDGVLPLDIISVRVVKIDPADRSNAEKDFTIRMAPTTPFTLNPGDSTLIGIDFKSDSASLRQARLQIQHNAPQTPAYVILSGIATEPRIALAGTQCNFLLVKVDKLRDTTLVDWIRNPGNGILSIDGITIDGAGADQFTILHPPAFPLLIPGGGAAPLSIRFQPTSEGYKTARILIANNASPAPKEIAISGSGVIPYFDYTPFALNWDTVGVGRFNGKVFNIINSGPVELDLMRMALSTRDSNDFVITYYYPHAIAVADTYGVWINFRPTDLRERRSSLLIYTDAPNSPEVIQMKGIGGILNGVREDYLPARYTIPQNYPNPFRVSTVIDLRGIPMRPEEAGLKIYDFLGRFVADLTADMRRQMQDGGGRITILRGSFPGPGFYRYLLTTPAGARSRGMIVGP